MSKIIRLLSFSALFSVLNIINCSYADDFDPSWSTNFSVEPTTPIASPEISSLNAEISHITRLSCHQSQMTEQQCQQIADSGGLFDLLIDSNRDGILERMSTGVAKLKAGGYAKVLIIEDNLTQRADQVLIIESEIPGFSALYFDHGVVMWGMCLSCDVLADIVWKNGAYEAQWLMNSATELSHKVLVSY